MKREGRGRGAYKTIRLARKGSAIPAREKKSEVGVNDLSQLVIMGVDKTE